MKFDLENGRWINRTDGSGVSGDRVEIVTAPKTDLWQRSYYGFRNNNAPALLEYGNAEVPEEFEFIRTWSPYQNVVDGTAYPAVMFSTGDLDTRVPPLGARKMTARLQGATTSGSPVILLYHPKAGHAGSRGVPTVGWRW